MSIDNNQWSAGVINVNGGRGFVVEGKNWRRYTITAAHCLPSLPPPHPGSYFHERTYSELLGPLGGERTVWAECVFVDPVADIAVLGSPDDQVLSDEAEQYEALTEAATPLSISDLPALGPENARASEGIEAWLLSSENHWGRCRIKPLPRGLWIENTEEDIRSGMSGEPIMIDDGSAVGIICYSSALAGEAHRSGGPNPFLTRHLPGWLLRELNCS
jgi:hypothetical protein